MPAAPACETSIVSEALAASLGGAISSFMLFPLQVLKTRMQAVDVSSNIIFSITDDDENGDDSRDESSPKSAPSTSMIRFGQGLYRTHGISVFFRGVECSAFQSAVEKALYFFSYTFLKHMHRNLHLLASKTSTTNGSSYNLSTGTNLILGYVAEWTHLPISLPIDAWTTEIQTKKQNIDGQDSPLKILLTMLADKNRSFYKGLSAYYLLCFKPALQYTFYEQVKAAWLHSNACKTLTSPQAFFLGMMARAVATILIFPFLRAKVLLQTQQLQHGTTTGSSMCSVLWEQYKVEGLPGLFLGLGPELTRGVLSAAIMLTIKERTAGTQLGLYASAVAAISLAAIITSLHAHVMEDMRRNQKIM
jgi:solute carrier family 25 (peroxisomal adenine nucleotide transporter), member 17